MRDIETRIDGAPPGAAARRSGAHGPGTHATTRAADAAIQIVSASLGLPSPIPSFTATSVPADINWQPMPIVKTRSDAFNVWQEETCARNAA